MVETVVGKFCESFKINTCCQTGRGCCCAVTTKEAKVSHNDKIFTAVKDKWERFKLHKKTNYHKVLPRPNTHSPIRLEE